jgi:hypothetical protein
MPNTRKQDPSNVKGLPGNKRGPAVRKLDQNRGCREAAPCCLTAIRTPITGSAQPTVAAVFLQILHRPRDRENLELLSPAYVVPCHYWRTK